MDARKKEEGKKGIFSSLKKRFWSNNAINSPRSYFKGKSSKLKVKSESSHCNLNSDYDSCNGRPSCDGAQNIVSRSALLNINKSVHKNFSSSEPTISNCDTIDVNNISLCSSDVHSCIREDNRMQTDPTLLQRNNDEVCNSAPLNVPNSVIVSNSLLETDRSDLCGESGNESDNAYEEVGLHLKSGLSCKLLKLSKYGWYWGSITKEEAEEKLTDQPDGAFLLRDSSADHFILSLSFRSSGKTLHTRIEYNLGKGVFSFYQQSEESFSSIEELIEHSMSFSKSAVYCYSVPRSPGHPAFPVRLTKPVSRFAQVRSLQYLCRFVIRESIRLDYIQKLPLPNSIKGYIAEGQY